METIPSCDIQSGQEIESALGFPLNSSKKLTCARFIQTCMNPLLLLWPCPIKRSHGWYASLLPKLVNTLTISIFSAARDTSVLF